MKILRTMFVAAVGAAALLTGCSTGQPHPGCYMQSSSAWFFSYTRTSATPTCSQAQLTNQAFNGERVGVFKYRTPGENDARLVLRPARVGGASAGTNPQDVFDAANAIGKQEDEPDDQRFCAVAQMNPAVAPTTGGTRRYEYSDVKTYAGARSLGQQMVGKLRYSEPGTGGDCVMEFDMQGIWPRVACDPAIEPGSEAAKAVPLLTCGEGSGVNSDIRFKCVDTPDAAGNDGELGTADDLLGFCAPADPTPSYKPGIEEIDYAD